MPTLRQSVSRVGRVRSPRAPSHDPPTRGAGDNPRGRRAAMPSTGGRRKVPRRKAVEVVANDVAGLAAAHRSPNDLHAQRVTVDDLRPPTLDRSARLHGVRADHSALPTQATTTAARRAQARLRAPGSTTERGCRAAPRFTGCDACTQARDPNTVHHDAVKLGQHPPRRASALLSSVPRLGAKPAPHGSATAGTRSRGTARVFGTRRARESTRVM
jgi:hypothetical protein